METRVSWTLLVVLVSLATLVPAARADLTVSFATDGAVPAMSASVVCGAAESVAAPEPAPQPEVTQNVEAPSPTPIETRFVRVGDGSGESATLTLRDASGTAANGVLEQLSVLARPRGVEAPASIDHDDPDFVAPGIRRLNEGLLPLLARLSEHFPDRAIEIVSGYRPNAREGSRHRFGRALDLRVAGVPIDEVRAYLDGEPRTGVGLYPTSGFVHLDVRSESVRWVDDSGPGEAPHVVRSEVVARAEPARAPETPSEPVPTDDAPASVDPDAIERAMHAADAITLDFALAQ